ncbi:MAG: energy transducer TonB [Muribaculaceae bacterium]|nr:energy transducer TonB [Muribaculaceae bacterium]
MDWQAEQAREALLKQQQETVVNQMSEEDSEEDVEEIKQEEKQEPEEIQEAQQQVTELAIVPDEKVTQPPQLTTEVEKNEADISAQNVEGQLSGIVDDIKPQEAPKPVAVVEQKVQVEAPKPVEENKVFTSVEQMPQFPGGDAALMKHIASHMQYPPMAQEQGIQGKCIVQFVVTKTGSVGEVKVVRSLSPDCDNEAKRVVKGLPKFTPGKQNGQPVNVWYTLPVTFKLQN